MSPRVSYDVPCPRCEAAKSIGVSFSHPDSAADFYCYECGAPNNAAEVGPWTDAEREAMTKAYHDTLDVSDD